MPQVPLAFESEGPNGNWVTKQLPNYHSPDLEKSVEWLNGSSLTVLSPNCHLAVQTQIQMQTEPGVF